MMNSWSFFWGVTSIIVGVCFKVYAARRIPK